MDDKPLTDEVLAAWGAEWLRVLEAGTGSGFHVPVPVLRQFLARSILALGLAKRRRSKRGRPLGSGMGAEAADLIANGVETPAAVRAIARRHGKEVKAVQAALRWYRAHGE
jgi:aryl-alcohol dehydrogenase-like predicted oxidoreductase